MSAPINCSVIIRTRGCEDVPRILNMLIVQKSNRAEISEVVIMYGGQDCDAFGFIHVYQDVWKIFVEKYNGELFSYGSATNQAISLSSGKVIVSLSGHSVPSNDSWLDTLVSGFCDSNNVCGVTGGQMPEVKVNSLERTYRWLFYGNSLSASLLKPFNMTNAAIRRDVWEQIKFDEKLPACEDKFWSYLQERRGLKTAMRIDAIAFHAHDKKFMETLRDLMWLSRYRIGVWMRSWLLE